MTERSRGAALPLPPALVTRYDGELTFSPKRPLVFANFVTTLDGIVSFGGERPQARFISRGNDDDRFMLGFLRACADCVVVGASTLRIEGPHHWTPEAVYPAAAAEFAALRRSLGKPPTPREVFVTASGDIDLHSATFSGPSDVTVITTSRGARRLGAAPRHVDLRVIDTERPDGDQILAALPPEVKGLVLTEGGPTLIGELLGAGLVDELFLTVAPQLAGRSREERRVGLVEGKAFAPENAPWGKVLSVKQGLSDFLFLRIALGQEEPSAAS